MAGGCAYYLCGVYWNGLCMQYAALHLPFDIRNAHNISTE